MKGSKQILLIMGIISLIVLFIFTLFIMAQLAKHYEHKSDSSDAHTFNSSIIVKHDTMSKLSQNISAPIQNITSSHDIHSVHFMANNQNFLL
ncbi:TPA: hypothetical protein ACGI1V_002753 [Staphylococcus argenteus]|uniref:Putative exported protein n=1 Tax=Staphylococcus argenteus TaxID=985002 RepID=A0A7U7JRM3_9STAP|nr:hypothetical protein [Staphylococcus argenteus]BBN31210.1 hypothetical protein KUH140087_2083 [Staphylococcus aureus]ATY57931.1 hypothetical protein CJ017_12250 [Staphylococcus argenteus]ATZ88155.1 hypothetical protein CKO49_12245 [Staphylococcus argenteus]EKF1504509.1 hypothetical protein [Staphylococcus argenteus]EYG94106.1 hypothetical protein V676_00552 [Staphylococcus argenteus]